MQYRTATFEPAVAKLVAGSALGRWIRRTSRVAEIAFASSTAMPVLISWSAHVRARAGVVLMAAAATTMAMHVVDGLPSGWMWSIPPIVAAAGGALLYSRRRSAEPSA